MAVCIELLPMLYANDTVITPGLNFIIISSAQLYIVHTHLSIVKCRMYSVVCFVVVIKMYIVVA